MGSTIIEKIIAEHCGRKVSPGDTVELLIDARIARDFGGANVVKNLEQHKLGIDDLKRTFFTFDCNPTGSDQGYAANQQFCRIFARQEGIRLFDINKGIGTHLAIDHGLVLPGGTLISTDSHANIVGAIGAFGQGMGDRDIAYAFAFGKVWFVVPPTVKLIFEGMPHKGTGAKDVVLALLRHFGAHGLLGYAAELYGEYIDQLKLDGRITIASMATEMGAIALLIPPNREVIDYCRSRTDTEFTPLYADPSSEYQKTETIDISELLPLISRPGHPDDVVRVSDIAGRKIDSAFIGCCTNGRLEDMRTAAQILKGHKVAPDVVLKVVPTTDRIWHECLHSGIIDIFKQAGALVGNAGCAGCAAGQIGQNGPGEVTISTGNRNFPGKQGKGEVYLASPATAAASAIAGIITIPDAIPDKPAVRRITPYASRITPEASRLTHHDLLSKPTVIQGRVWVVSQDDIDTDMIFHNRYLAVTDISEMGQYAFGNLEGWKDFAEKTQAGDIIVTGRNFGAGSSRQQAVDCFKSLGISLIIARSFGSIYFRNAVNAGLAVIQTNLTESGIKNRDKIEINLSSGEVRILNSGKTVKARPFSPVQMEIYQRGGLLAHYTRSK
ncbi:homoaconitate hydratase [candidate division WOR-3 bacterium JGI_Cruoil_03_51_56]|uniref:Homoaconitate hydratase n=1 Tax=candidate division WOR-3 bacterium JGI_Cruoil_03_51_56 TaxID=1973747 RepID=A0A235BUV9_UNCW3|nr:MAG: homoaconitate hydratase [candidate division WOR-3 bacterium JGI_Cruoil_03_51_56]